MYRCTDLHTYVLHLECMILLLLLILKLYYESYDRYYFLLCYFMVPLYVYHVVMTALKANQKECSTALSRGRYDGGDGADSTPNGAGCTSHACRATHPHARAFIRGRLEDPERKKSHLIARAYFFIFDFIFTLFFLSDAVRRTEGSQNTRKKNKCVIPWLPNNFEPRNTIVSIKKGSATIFFVWTF